MKRLALSFLCLTLLGACETTGGGRYPPVGASEQPLEADRYRVSFRGASRASEAEVRDRALLHAAELTLGHGYDWFRVIDRQVGVAPPTTPQISIGIGGASFGRHSGIGVGGETSFAGAGTFVVTLEIVAGHGAKPGDPDAYDARSVTQNLRSRFPA